MLYQIAKDQLDRVLGFFSREEAKITTLFAVDTGMLALLAANAEISHLEKWYLVLLSVVVLAILGISIWFLYLASYPQLDGGQRSIIYFKEIAERTESDYIKEASELEIKGYAEQLFAQTWRNAQILTEKFKNVKYAFQATAIALPFWFAAILLSTINNASLVTK